MTLKNITFKEIYSFENAAELRDFLNQFKKTDLEAVDLHNRDGAEHITITYETETLTDNSEVSDIYFI